MTKTALYRSTVDEKLELIGSAERSALSVDREQTVGMVIGITSFCTIPKERLGSFFLDYSTVYERFGSQLTNINWGILHVQTDVFIG